MLSSLILNNFNFKFHIFILCEELSEVFKEKIKLFFKYYKSSLSFEFLYLNDELLDSALVFGHVSRATYYRLLLPKVIPETVETLLYLDVDIILKNDLKALWEFPIENKSHLGIINLGIEDAYKLNLGISMKSDYFNAGVILINIPWWRLNNVYEKSLDFIKSHPEKIILWDQDVLNVVLEGKWKELPFEYNAQEQIFREDMKSQYPIRNFLDSYYNPIIIHYTGGGHSKPWFKECRHELKNEYIYYYFKSRRFHVKTDKWLYFLGRDIKLNHITVFLILLQRFTRKLRYFFHLQKIKYFI